MALRGLEIHTRPFASPCGSVRLVPGSTESWPSPPQVGASGLCQLVRSVNPWGLCPQEACVSSCPLARILANVGKVT